MVFQYRAAEFSGNVPFALMVGNAGEKRGNARTNRDQKGAFNRTSSGTGRSAAWLEFSTGRFPLSVEASSSHST